MITFHSALSQLPFLAQPLISYQNAAAYQEAQSDIDHWLKDIINESYHLETSTVPLQAAPRKTPITPAVPPMVKPLVESAVDDTT